MRKSVLTEGVQKGISSSNLTTMIDRPSTPPPPTVPQPQQPTPAQKPSRPKEGNK